MFVTSGVESLVRVVVLDTCLLVCGDRKNTAPSRASRCENDMDATAAARVEHMVWVERELAKPARWKARGGGRRCH
jgi:hypothetical protein